mmetsp:Transcript_160490/g.515160  ORF Transcript_160490/g.515160 Transcript_160490/m.515160 type:complete len:258 (-) Transcript_160490:25-798(-)
MIEQPLGLAVKAAIAHTREAIVVRSGAIAIWPNVCCWLLTLRLCLVHLFFIVRTAPHTALGMLHGCKVLRDELRWCSRMQVKLSALQSPTLRPSPVVLTPCSKCQQLCLQGNPLQYRIGILSCNSFFRTRSHQMQNSAQPRRQSLIAEATRQVGEQGYRRNFVITFCTCGFAQGQQCHPSSDMASMLLQGDWAPRASMLSVSRQHRRRQRVAAKFAQMPPQARMFHPRFQAAPCRLGQAPRLHRNIHMSMSKRPAFR